MKARPPCRLFVCVCECAPRSTFMYTFCVLCASKNHHRARVRQSEQKHTSGSIQDAWNSLPAWFRLLPEPPCWLCRRADKLCRSTQCLAYSTCNWKGVGWQGLEVKLSLQAGSGCRWASSGRLRYANLLLLNHCRPLLTVCRAGEDPQGRACKGFCQTEQHLNMILTPPRWYSLGKAPVVEGQLCRDPDQRDRDIRPGD